MKRSWIGIACAVAVLAGCGMPVDEKPRVVPPEDVPFELLSTSDDSAPDRPTAAPDAVPITIYLLADDKLVPVVRSVAPAPTIDDRLNLLQEGPTSEEAAANLRSAVDPGPGVLHGATEGSTVVVTLPASFAAVAGPDHVLAVAQVVYTVTDAPDVQAVSFELDGHDVEVPTGEGTLTSAPVTRTDFRGVIRQ